jgi:hypothetical protein
LASEDRLKTWETLFRKALRAIDSVGEPVFSLPSWSFGGGTVLMRRFRHRFSRDVDLFVPDPQYLGYLDPDLNETVEGLTPKHLKAANFLRLYFDEGEVDFIAAAPVTVNPRVIEKVLDRDIQVDTSIEIVAKKIRYRAAEFTARDVFDFALVVEKEPNEVSKIEAVIQERRDTILQRLASGDKILRTAFKELDTLEYRPSYDHCLGIVRKALGV